MSLNHYQMYAETCLSTVQMDLKQQKCRSVLSALLLVVCVTTLAAADQASAVASAPSTDGSTCVSRPSSYKESFLKKSMPLLLRKEKQTCSLTILFVSSHCDG